MTAPPPAFNHYLMRAFHVDEDVFVDLGIAEDPVTNGSVWRWDSGTREPGRVRLQMTVFDEEGNEATASVPVVVS